MGIKFKMGVVAILGALLASCGGGGSGGNIAPNRPATVTMSLGQTQTTPRSLVDVQVTVRASDGLPAPNGTTVTLQVSPPSVGQVSFGSDGASGGAQPNGIAIGDRVTGTVAGGIANFRFHSRSVGTAVLTASASLSGVSLTATSNLNVVAGPPSDPRLRLDMATLNLPPNFFNVSPFIGSPFMSEGTITWRRLNGELVTTVPTQPQRELITLVSVNPINPNGGFTTLDDPETEDDPSTVEIENNEFLIRLGQGPVDMVAGLGTIFVHSGNVPSQFTVTVTALDPDTDETLEAQAVFTVASTTLPLPSSIELTRLGAPVYTSTSGGNSSEQIIANVEDGSGLFVPDPIQGNSRWNNVQFEILGGAQGGERLRGLAANGSQVTGGRISTKTAQGIAQIAYESGTRQGTIRIRATADKADNNVDNGISEPIDAFTDITVSDGRLFDLDLTSPPGITQNGVLVEVDADEFVLDPDGTYSLTISAIATDRLGNPVLPGTEIRFGKIDSPLSRNEFVIGDDDGDPQEGGTGFTDIDGMFTTLGGGVGPGDTVIVFGEDVVGNRDLESARTVQSVNSPSSITVARRFNFNDDTGASVNSGPILPYIIGRSVDGNVGTFGYTDLNGVARTTLNYPVSKLGKRAAVYAQGSGDIVNGLPELVTDAEYFRFAGIAPGVLVASPSSIPGNRTVDIDVCYSDALGNPISGSFVNFSFSNLSGGTGSVDGVTVSGTTSDPTGPDGCVTVSARTVGMVPPASGGGTEAPTLTFSVGPATTEVEIVTGSVLLSAAPTTVSGDGGRPILLTLTDSDGNPVQGAIITGMCTASGGTLTISTNPPPTNANGQTTAIVTAEGFSFVGMPTMATGQCVFSAGSAMATVTWTSQDSCLLFSPQAPAGCPAATLNITIVGAGNVISNPAGIVCTGPTIGACTRNFAPNTPVTLSLSSPPTSWGGDCAAFGTAQSATIVLGADGSVRNCTVTFP